MKPPPPWPDRRARQGILAILLLLAAVPAAAQGHRAPGDWGGGPPAWFDAEAKGGFDLNGRPVVQVVVSIPYRNLIFLRTGTGGFRAAWSIRLTQRGEDQRPLTSRLFRGEVVVDGYDATRSSELVRRELALPLIPVRRDEVDVEVRVEQEGTDRFGERTLTVAPPRAPREGVALGEVTLFRRREAVVLPPRGSSLVLLDGPVDATRYERAASEVFDLSSGAPYLLVQVYDLGGGPADSDSHVVELRIVPDDGGGPATWRRRIGLPAGARESAALVGLPADAFGRGKNRVVADLAGGDERSVIVDNRGLDPLSDRQWDQNLEVIETLATKEELRDMEEAPPEARASRWEAFWARRDPDPAVPGNPRLEEHFRRVEYARRYYGDGFSDGALSDRGRVYVHLGPPESVETQVMLMSTSASFELWHYPREGLVFYFRDDDGLGRWRLVWREQI
jgi:GWxTD domain-containing protein